MRKLLRQYDVREVVLNIPSVMAEEIKGEAWARACTEQAFILWCVRQQMGMMKVLREQQASDSQADVRAQGEALGGEGGVAPRAGVVEEGWGQDGGVSLSVV